MTRAAALFGGPDLQVRPIAAAFARLLTAWTIDIKPRPLPIEMF
jgi:hypothetical protein